MPIPAIGIAHLHRAAGKGGLGLHERGVGGLGILMVKKTMDDVRYEYRDGRNTLTVIKSL